MGRHTDFVEPEQLPGPESPHRLQGWEAKSSCQSKCEVPVSLRDKEEIFLLESLAIELTDCGESDARV